MEATDTVFGMDWSDSTYIGDGIYLMDFTRVTGVPSVALRADRTNGSNVIVLEEHHFDEMVKAGRAAIAHRNNLRLLEERKNGA